MIVADASPLIHLSRIGRLDLFRKIYGTILIPDGVHDEVVVEAEGRPGSSEVKAGIDKGWIKTARVSVPKVLQSEGATGADGEVIVLAENRHISLLTNDRAVAAIAKTRGIKVVWLTRALMDAVEKGIVTSDEAKVILRDLVRAGLRVKSEVLAEIFHLLDMRGRKGKDAMSVIIGKKPKLKRAISPKRLEELSEER